MTNKALKLIEKCIKTHNPYLDLGNCGLTDDDFREGTVLDNAIKKCVHVKTLILSHSWLDPENNEKDEIYSQNIDHSKKELFYNILNQFPSSLFALKELEFLACSGLKINDLLFAANFKNLISLSVRSSKITKTTGIEQLIKLKHLDLGLNEIDEIIGFENLTNLESLNAYGNQINEIKGIETLYKLRHLNLYNNRINEIKNLKNLTSLLFLRISQNNIRRTKGLSTLKNLEYLDIGNNPIKSIEGLDNLIYLRTLDARSCSIFKMQGLKNLKSLQFLDFSRNEISRIEELENLTKLKEIDLSHNNITDLKPLMPLLKNAETPWYIGETSEEIKFSIITSPNPLTSPPIEIAKQGKQAILNYFTELENRGTEYLYEAKMLIVGQPRAGKTSLRYKLFDINATLPEEDKTTRGIDIERLSFNIEDREGKSREFHYNVWDFGGQQIYQATHQFFLTHRSLYLLVVDTGKDNIGNDDNNINYWLQAVELLGGNSPLLLARNEKNDRVLNLDIAQKRTRFDFLKGDYSIDLNALIRNTKSFNEKRYNEFKHLEEDIRTELKRLPLVGFPMPKNWVQIRNELQTLSTTEHYIHKQKYIDICKKFDVADYDRQMELSLIFHDLGIFLHFQKYPALADYIILQNTWATDAVFAVLDNAEIRNNKGRFADKELSSIWKAKGYEAIVHNMLLGLMMQFELCYKVDSSYPSIYIVPEMLSDSKPEDYEWKINNDLPLQYRYDFMPKGILTRLIVRLHKYIDQYNGQQIVWKTGVKIDGKLLDCPNTFIEITEAWNNKQLNIRAQGPFAKDSMSKITFQIDELNNEFFRQVSNDSRSQKSKWYKMIPCNCITCKSSSDKHFYDHGELLERKEFKKATIECKKKPFADVNIAELLDGIFSKEVEKETKGDPQIQNVTGNLEKEQKTINIFLASSSELMNERKEFRIFINDENKRLHKKGILLNLEIWEDFLDVMSQSRLQDEYNKTIKDADIFVMLFFTKVGKYTSEEFETAFRQFKASDKPKILTYFKRGDIPSTDISRTITTLLDFQDRLKELKHFHTEFESNSDLHLHFKKQLERLYDI